MLRNGIKAWLTVMGTDVGHPPTTAPIDSSDQLNLFAKAMFSLGRETGLCLGRWLCRPLDTPFEFPDQMDRTLHLNQVGIGDGDP